MYCVADLWTGRTRAGDDGVDLSAVSEHIEDCNVLAGVSRGVVSLHAVSDCKPSQQHSTGRSAM